MSTEWALVLFTFCFGILAANVASTSHHPVVRAVVVFAMMCVVAIAAWVTAS